MIDTEALTAEERDLRSGLLGAAGTAQLGGTGTRALHPPSPHAVLIAGRRARARRRAGALSMLTAAALSVAVAGVGLGSGSLTLPWLRADGSASPGTLSASPGTRVGDLVNAIDPGKLIDLSTLDKPDHSVQTRWYYRSGPRAADAPLPEADRQYVPDRFVDVRRHDGPDPLKAPIDFLLGRVDPLTDRVEDSRVLGTLGLDEDGRGSWMQEQPSAQEGWLVLAVLPTGASAVQARVAGTEFLLPLDDVQASDYPGDEITELSCPGAPEDDGVITCGADPTQRVVRLRFATADSRPPIDAITYIDQDGRYVTLDAADQVH